MVFSDIIDDIEEEIADQRYRKRDSAYLIEIDLESPEKLYDRRDPSPIKGRDLNEELADYIFNSVSEIPLKYEVILKLSFNSEESSSYPSDKIRLSIHNYFKMEEHYQKLELRRTIKKGFKGLFVGLFFLFIAIFISHLLEAREHFILSFISEGLHVLGWVSMWHPMNIFLYEWWPIKDRIRLLEKTVRMQTEIRYAS